MEQRYQVIIVGGGPVGVAPAVDLGIRGISCALVEQHLTPQRIPKGQNLTQRSLEHFYFWGIADELRAERLLPPGFPISGITAYGNLMSEHRYAPVGRESVRSYYYQANERLPQYLTEEVLRRRMNDLPNVSSFFGWLAESIQQDGQGVTVKISQVNGIDGVDGPGEHVLKAEYLVGCDGARSPVREQLGIERNGTDFHQKMVLTVIRSPELHKGLKSLGDRTTYRALNPDMKGVWQFFGRIDVGEGFFFHGPVPDDATPENYDFLALMEKAAGFSSSCTFEHIGFWDLRVAVADTYRKGRAFIAGDAAHSHPPYGAFGLNSGLEDITNLGWKLAASLHGWGGEPLLDSYSAERQPAFVGTGEGIIAAGIKSDGAFLERYSPDRDIEEFVTAWKALETEGSSRPGSYVPHYEGSPVIFGPAGSTCGVNGSHSFAARPGHHLAPQPLTSSANVFEELGPGYTLLAFGSEDSDVDAFAQAAKALGIPLKVIRDTYVGDRQAYEARLILVRPDQFVAWVGDQVPPDPTGILRRSAGIEQQLLGTA